MVRSTARTRNCRKDGHRPGDGEAEGLGITQDSRAAGNTLARTCPPDPKDSIQNMEALISDAIAESQKENI